MRVLARLLVVFACAGTAACTGVSLSPDAAGFADAGSEAGLPDRAAPETEVAAAETPRPGDAAAADAGVEGSGDGLGELAPEESGEPPEAQEGTAVDQGGEVPEENLADTGTGDVVSSETDAETGTLESQPGDTGPVDAAGELAGPDADALAEEGGGDAGAGDPENEGADGSGEAGADAASADVQETEPGTDAQGETEPGTDAQGDAAPVDAWQDLPAEDVPPADLADAAADDIAPPPPAPTILYAAILPSEAAPLSATLMLVTDLPTVLTVTVTDATDGTGFAVTPPEGPAEDHYVPLLGMAAGRSFDVAAVATAGEGGTAAVVLTHSTPALPDAFPQMTTVACSPAKMAPGYTLMSLDRNNPGEYFGGGYLVVLDSQSRVVWYLDPKTSPQKVSRTDDGNLRFVRGVEGIQEISMLGDVVQEWWADELGIDTLHHRFSGLPGGNLLVLDTGHPGTEHATRAVEYDLDFDLDDDGVHWKASEVWSWGEPEKLYDGGPGMVSILANKNVLLLEGSVIANPGISPLDPANSTWVRLVELDRSIQPNEVVYELHLKEKAPESPVRWSSLSVSRIDTLYPPGYVVAPVP